MSEENKTSFKLICSICKNPIPTDVFGWSGGHNAQPVNKGRCCEACNALVVIPARFNNLRQVGKVY